MHRYFLRRLLSHWPFGVLLLGLLASHVRADDPCGCCNRRCCSHIQPALPAEPLGAHVRRFEAVQVANAQASNFEIYLDEWYEGGKTLGPYGQYHITQIAQRLPAVPFAVKVQPCNDVTLNELRRQIVVTALLNLGIRDADSRVIIAYPQAEGLRGEEAEFVYWRSISDALITGRFGGYGPYGRYGLGGYGGFGFGFGGLYGGLYGRSALGIGTRPLIAGY
jgi:hypothetical protein